MNAQHLMIHNGAVGIFNLFGNGKELNITSRAYNIFQPILMKKSIKGQVIAKDDNYNNSHYIINGMIVNSLINDTIYSFNAYLTNITDNKSLNITTTKQYSLNNISSIISITECITNKTKYSNITYCPFQLRFNDELNDTNDIINDGEYILSISRYNIYNMAINGSIYDTNYFLINNVMNYDNKSYQFLIYSSQDMIVEINKTRNGTINMVSYESASIFKGMVYVTLENKDNIFIFNCAPQYIEQYTSFGWKFSDNQNTLNTTNIISGSYKLKLYWNTPTTKSSIGISNQYRLITNGQIFVDVTIYTQNNKNYVNIITVKAESNIKPFELIKGDSNNFKFISSIQMGSIINIYYEQCTNLTFQCIK